MSDLAVRTANQPITTQITLRDAAMPVFRQRQLALLVFLGILCGAVLTAILLPRKYEAEMKILLIRDRADSVVTPDPNAAPPVATISAISEEDINSEVELLKSRDLLEQVVRSCDLVPKRPSLPQRFGDLLRGAPTTDDTRLAESVQQLEDRLTVEPMKKSNLIRVAYPSRDPQQSARVLQTLATLYQEKHAAVHRPAGAFSFFNAQVDRYRDELVWAETQLENFDRQEDVVAPDQQKQLVVQQMSQFEAELQQDESSAQAARARQHTLHVQAAGTPERQTAQMRKLDNAQLLADLESTLLSLELKRADMLMKYAPEYPPVQALEIEISDARKAIAQARQSPIEEVTTDRAPTQDWIATELAKAQADQAQFEAQAVAASRAVRRYRDVAQKLDQKGTLQDDLARNVKAAEDDYLLYLHKREEARISDQLDSKRIVNVSIAEAATTPVLPTLNLAWLLVGGFFTASTASIGAAYAADRMDPSFRTPDELQRYLDTRVLAAIPTSTTDK